ncbi:ester cyclase [Salaquimonas pukyongi]|uniref:ester cyclase n=1 Tax=Salaquimonas pukyongi TaxID=2712698 RepID=UPI00096BBD60|nr:ester cyclase [Salaquimonas pukyongi]
MTKLLKTITALFIAGFATQAFAQEGSTLTVANPESAGIAAALSELAARQASDARIQTNLDNFDTLDFDVYTNQKWDRLHESHAEDIIVHYPDGRTVQGIEPHIEELKWMFTWAPDTRIEKHPVRIGQGEWTAVVGEVEGTFTEPMQTQDGVIQPTGKALKLTMATIARWNEDGTMDEEYLFWDNKEFMRQIGLGE